VPPFPPRPALGVDTPGSASVLALGRPYQTREDQKHRLLGLLQVGRDVRLLLPGTQRPISPRTIRQTTDVPRRKSSFGTREKNTHRSSLCLTKVPTSLLPAISRVRIRRKDPGIVRQSVKGKFPACFSITYLTFPYQRLLLLADTDKEPAEGKGFPRRWKPYLLVLLVWKCLVAIRPAFCKTPRGGGRAGRVSPETHRCPRATLWTLFLT
jgi:hypothetical protein